MRRQIFKDDGGATIWRMTDNDVDRITARRCGKNGRHKLLIITIDDTLDMRNHIGKYGF